MSNLPFEQKPIQIYASGLINSDVPTDPVDGSFLDLVAVVDDYQALRFKHGWYQPGDFEITINKNTLYAQEFQRKRIIQISDDVYKCGVIEYVQNDIGPDGALSELITVRGRELTSYLDRRIINPPSGQAYYSLPSTTPAETVVKSLVYDCLGAGASANRQDANMTIETDLGQGDGYVVSARWDNLLTVVSNCCLATYSGVFAYLNHTTKKWVLGFSLGLDRTTSQTTNPQAVFSTDRETVLKATLKDMDQGYKNFALVAGQGEGTARTTVTVPTIEPTGIDRRELFVDARDLELSASLTNRGLQKLSENQWVKFLTSDVLAYSQLVYGQDYNVGDQVTVQQFGQAQDAYVTSAEEYWSNGKYNLGIGFDRSSPTLPSQVSGAFSQLQKTMNATELPTDLAVLSDIPNYPLQTALMSMYSFDSIPSITYPDSEAGAAYVGINFVSTTGWTVNSGSPVSTFANGIWTVVSDASGEGYARSGVTSGQMCLVRLRATVGTVIVRLNSVDIRTLATSDGWQTVSSIATGSTSLVIYSASGTWEIEWVYIGNGSYSWTIGDDSGNGKVLTPKGGITRASGRSGNAVQFDGVTGSLSGNISGLTTKLTVSFWWYFTAFGASPKVLMESSVNMTGTDGAFLCSIDDTVLGSGSITFSSRMSSGNYLIGAVMLPSAGWHHITLELDTSQSDKTLALSIFIDAIRQTLTFPAGNVGSTTVRSALYNGTFYVGSRAGSSLFSSGIIDELRFDSSTLAEENVEALYRIPMAQSVNQTGYGARVLANDPSIFGSFPVLQAKTQTVNKTVPTGYNAVVYGQYEISSQSILTIDGTFVIL